MSFYGTTAKRNGSHQADWVPGETIQSSAYDVPIPGYATRNTINIRLWRSAPARKFDLKSFNEGDYSKSVEESMRAENITSVLYPNDSTSAGKELRLKQQVTVILKLKVKVLLCVCYFARYYPSVQKEESTLE